MSVSTSSTTVQASTLSESSHARAEWPDAVPRERLPVRTPEVWNPVRIAPETD
ncbi:hypothetical protein ACFRJ9_07630 [Paenarthrobacter sp. NPDC056912]|uniref:hypothetical protein n=1 Tax=Paenarthrobacter sp. NPDC056912 TaxID=3345965 RepID=UPI00366E4F1D